MLNALLNAEMTYAERLELTGQVVLIGLGTVFAVLAILMIAIYIFQFFSYTLPQRRNAEKKEKPVAAAPVAAPVVEAAPVAAPADDLELIAVITAAIAAYETDESGAALPFRVVSLKRKAGRTSWNGNTGIE